MSTGLSDAQSVTSAPSQVSIKRSRSAFDERLQSRQCLVPLLGDKVKIFP